MHAPGIGGFRPCPRKWIRHTILPKASYIGVSALPSRTVQFEDASNMYLFNISSWSGRLPHDTACPCHDQLHSIVAFGHSHACWQHECEVRHRDVAYVACYPSIADINARSRAWTKQQAGHIRCSRMGDMADGSRCFPIICIFCVAGGTKLALPHLPHSDSMPAL